MIIQQMVLLNPFGLGVDKHNELTFVIQTKEKRTRWSVYSHCESSCFYESYTESFQFKDIYVTENLEQNTLD